ncbi:MAG TPA: site-specific integrase [Methylomirabilota bacterium]|nr:site-specific integrase [Methylomirabilota bacterium]
MGVQVREKPKGSGIWWLFIHHGGTRRSKRVGVGAKGKKLAEDAAVKIRARLLEGDLAVFAPPPAVVTAPAFAELAARWFAWYPSLTALRPGTLENHAKIIRAHLTPFFGDTPVDQITRRRVQEFIAAKRGPGGSPQTGKALADSTLLTLLPTLRLILDYAVEERWLSANPMAGGIRLWRPSQAPEHVDPFTGRELRAILQAAAAIDPDAAVFFRLWAQSGLRSGELRALRRGDLDLAAGMVHVQRSRTKGRLGPTKTGRTRLVSVVHPICEDTAAWQPGATAESLALVPAIQQLRVTSLEPDGELFGRVLHERWLHTLWRRVLIKAGIRYREVEQLRHTFASTLLSRNAPLLYVAQQGGWKNPGVLLKHYARWMPQVVAHPAAPQAHPRSRNTS